MIADSKRSFPVAIARGFSGRLIGWMGRARPPIDRLLLIPGCRAVHTCFMRFPIDLIFVDRHAVVVRVARGLVPWRIAICAGAAAVIEAPAGLVDALGIRPGERFSGIDPDGRVIRGHSTGATHEPTT